MVFQTFLRLFSLDERSLSIDKVSHLLKAMINSVSFTNKHPLPHTTMLHPALNASVNTINDERKCLPNHLLYGNISKGVISVKVTLVNISRRIHWPTMEIDSTWWLIDMPF